ncbi:type I glutamate--ammonia ligase [Clostridium formicaceticum]|uniref:Glutamine synthetase n=1 Tax=Clostridium formicaceticum TaxID=1497 RepID=A0AAC9RGS5_9CLOT|nr:type I glutamate--ammonia ligase [Clostridium formicaceticum]AOY76234.1 type I glutamate--ammonia ligase [Clostridium formicaceticum]ARE86614.1 Glutamine synthetase [Clostridium formicaceticum]
MSNLNSDDVKRIVREENVRFIRLQFTDVFGKLKNVAITPNQLDTALNNEIMFDGSSIDGFVRIEESDMYLAPDPSTFTIFPWKSNGYGKIARMICDVYNPDGTPFEGCPRNVLKKKINQLREYGFEFYVGPEVEFFLFEADEKGRPTTEVQDYAGYFDLGPTDLGEEARRDICLTLEEMGFEIEASHHEVAPGQHEIDFKYDDALKTADNVSTFKLVVKSIAKKHGLHATFMPKPITGKHGTCMHLNQSLYKNGENAFYCSDDSLGLSKEAYYYIGGLIKHAREFAAITNATVNSYKRFVPGFEAPTDIAWATANRSPLIRIPAKRGAATRVELRNPDPTANHYLAFAAVLAAGFEGIKNKVEPPSCCNENIYDIDSKDKKSRGIQQFPESLKEAVLELETSQLMKETLGEHIHATYIEAKKKEWLEYSQEVHNWELQKYLAEY